MKSNMENEIASGMSAILQDTKFTSMFSNNSVLEKLAFKRVADENIPTEIEVELSEALSQEPLEATANERASCLMCGKKRPNWTEEMGVCKCAKESGCDQMNGCKEGCDCGCKAKHAGVSMDNLIKSAFNSLLSASSDLDEAGFEDLSANALILMNDLVVEAKAKKSKKDEKAKLKEKVDKEKAKAMKEKERAKAEKDKNDARDKAAKEKAKAEKDKNDAKDKAMKAKEKAEKEKSKMKADKEKADRLKKKVNKTAQVSRAGTHQDVINFINELGKLGLYSVLDKQMKPGDTADLKIDSDITIIEIQDAQNSQTSRRDATSTDLEELCLQFVERLKSKLSPEDYESVSNAASGAGITPIVGAALAYEAANHMKFPTMSQKLMTKK